MSTDLTSKNSAHFSLLNDTLLFQKYEFFIQFFCKNRKNLIFCERFFGAENYRSKIAVIFFQIGVPVEEYLFRKFLKYLENHAISDFFFYEVSHSAIFQPTCQKCMSGDNSILLVSEPSPLKNKCRFLMRFLKKKITQYVPSIMPRFF